MFEQPQCQRVNTSYGVLETDKAIVATRSFFSAESGHEQDVSFPIHIKVVPLDHAGVLLVSYSCSP
eukprot:scaffold524782_cov18-Prasinocladus_malaysianus.AAC.1